MIDKIENYNIILNIELIKQLERLKEIGKNRELVFFCVGNSKIWYDCFGPMMGTLLQYMGVKNYVYGNLKSNIDKYNIKEYVDIVYKYHYNPYMVVIDNCISASTSFDIVIKEGKVNCAGLSEKPVEIGDCGILCMTPGESFKSVYGYNKMLKCVRKIALYFKEIFI